MLVGSHHTAASLWDALDDPEVPARTRLGPPGVDVERFVPRERAAAAAQLAALAGRLRPRPRPACGAGRRCLRARRARPRRAALARLDPASDRLVAFVGKLIVSKGVDLLLAAWPLVLQSVPARGSWWSASAPTATDSSDCAPRSRRATAGEGDARAGRSLEDASASSPLAHLLAFLDRLAGEAPSAISRGGGAAASASC